MMSNLSLWVCIGSITFHLISGIDLTLDGNIAYTTGFTLICDVQGIITTSVTVNDPGGNPAVTCLQPPNPCGSADSNTFSRDVAAGTLTVNIIQSNVHTTNSVGSWTCTDGTQSDSYQVKEIVSFIKPIVWAASAEDGATVTMKFECIFPYPDEIKIEYVKASDNSSVLKTETGVTFTNGTASNCPVADARAISVEVTFTLSHSGLAESAVIRAAASFSGIVSPSYGYSNFTVTIVSPPTPDKCPLFQYAFWPCFCIVLVGMLLVIGVSCRVGKESKLQEGSLKKSCGCCPSDNTCCMAVCPLCTNLLCTDSKKIAKNVISVVVFLCVAAVIGVIIAFGLGVDSGKCILALILSIVCGLALMAIFTVSVYPHWPCLPEKGENGGNCFRTCRISTVEEPNRPAGNQDLSNRHTSRSPQASASEVRVTTEGRSPRPLENSRPLPAIGSEAKQLPPLGNEESALKKKPLNATLPEIPKSNKLSPGDTVNNEEDKPRKKKKKKTEKKKREEEGNVEDDKRYSQNSGGQANVEEEEQK